MSQSPSTPFMNIQDGYNSSKKVFTFNTQDRLGNIFDKITSMMGKLPAQGSSQNRPFIPKIYQGKKRGQAEIIMIKKDFKMDIDETVEIGECHAQVELSMDKIMEEGCSMIKIMDVTPGKEILEEHKITEVRILVVDTEVILGMITLVEVEVGLEKDSSQVTLGEMIEAVVGVDQVSRVSTNRDRVRCFICREYNHFAKDCPNISYTEKELSEQIQQMLDLEED